MAEYTMPIGIYEERSHGKGGSEGWIPKTQTDTYCQAIPCWQSG